MSLNKTQALFIFKLKELEELIKQEENVIHQTGIALERCLTDTHFTGSSEHIECNRLLLISCKYNFKILFLLKVVKLMFSR